ncbi:hypothetical protein WA026_015251 [Henosepilachna vigintioctopunctata]|uniref:Deacetylase sirtuin-type domain-containing protein n=1 Tax=Henosepilachna vigintioctopunctata TaxID=420089 RepID=A0AAW1TNV2_9CUCU
MNIFGKIRVTYLYSISSQFVPKHENVSEEHIKALRSFIDNAQNILVLTGAGISTESGIPDYRSENVGLYQKRNYKPIQHQEFCSSFKIRQRYWARNYIGWYNFSRCQPNSTHFFLRDLELVHNKVTSLVTQNVDNLHYKAGSKKVIELHGTAYQVICLNCKANFDRHSIQKKLEYQNPLFKENTDVLRPDGDVEIKTESLSSFIPPTCDYCGGILKPNIVFFGDNVPRQQVNLVRDKVSESDSLLILGSTVQVFSSYRIVLQALEENKKIAMVNIGPTRADEQVKLKISARCGEILPLL